MSARELKNHTGEVLARVRAGAHITVTNRGRPVAVLSPPEAVSDAAHPLTTPDEAWADILDTLVGSEPAFPTWQEAMRASRGRP